MVLNRYRPNNSYYCFCFVPVIGVDAAFIWLGAWRRRLSSICSGREHESGFCAALAQAADGRAVPCCVRPSESAFCLASPRREADAAANAFAYICIASLAPTRDGIKCALFAKADSGNGLTIK